MTTVFFLHVEAGAIVAPQGSFDVPAKFARPINRRGQLMSLPSVVGASSVGERSTRGMNTFVTNKTPKSVWNPKENMFPVVTTGGE